MYSAKNIECLDYRYRFVFDTAPDGDRSIKTKWEVYFFPGIPGPRPGDTVWHYAISQIILDPKHKGRDAPEIPDTKETGIVENYRSVGYIYAERLLIEFCIERF